MTYLMVASCSRNERLFMSEQIYFIESSAREIPAGEMPLSRLLSQGAEALKTSELLAVIANISNDLAERLLIRFNTLEGVARAAISDMQKIKGISTRKAAAIHASFTLGARLNQSKAASQEMDNPAKVYALLGEEMRLKQQECVKILLLNAKYKLIAIEEISRGSLDSVMAHPREVFRPAINRMAYAFVLTHNHPSGDATPSLADHQITTQLKKAADLLEIKFLDHVILGAPRLQEGSPYYSFRENGYL